MTTELDRWVTEATRCLSADAAGQVRAEIQEHYDSTREAAIGGGALAGEADRAALAALGDARSANRGYRKVLLTTREARLLKQGNWEARVICSNQRVKSLFRWMPAVPLLAALVLFSTGATGVARTLFLGSIVMGFLFIVPFLPVYTPARSRLARGVKWIVLAGMPVLAFGPDALKYSWLLIAVLWPIARTEWIRILIRRKLPVAQWPKQLYL
ncbi:MAG TPA: hypothetical protein VE779_02100 [Candidatus Angelobacter sp.]|nr:hypothetical protein [Candidatus Angelobacter sp.]